ncbi:MAG: dynamin family protein [Ignavibacteriaceae bacterium]|nr:dynamin family protein [Ignavibacteriaceae bacterium]
MAIRSLQDFTQLKHNVDVLLIKLSDSLAHDCKSNNNIKDVEQLRNKLNSATFKVLVVGEFSSGKSTFLNAILRNKILPTATTETTATINIIKYGTPEKAVITYWGDKDEKGNEISKGETEEIKLCQMMNYTALTKESNDKVQKIRHIDVYYPSKYCENGIELVDTPGLNTTYEYHELSTLEFLPNGHAAIFLLNATQFLSESERIYLTTFRRYMTKFMFVVNRIDESNFIDDDPLEVYIDKHWPKKLKSVIESNETIVLYPMNSKLAESGNWAESGMQKFITDLEAFLTSSDKAKEMIRPVINQSLETLNYEISKTNGLLNALNFSPEEFNNKLQTIYPQIEMARSTQKEIVRHIDERLNNITIKYENYATEILSEFANNVNFFIIHFKDDAEELKGLLPNSIKSNLAKALIEIGDFTNREVNKLKDEVSRRYDDLCANIEAVRNDLSSNQKQSLVLSLQKEISSDKNETYLLEDNILRWGGSAGIGALAAILLTGPIALIAGVLGGGVWGKFMQDKIRQKQLTKIADHVYKELRISIDDLVPQGKKMIINDSNAFKKIFNKSIESSIQNIDDMIKAIIQERKNSEEQIKQNRVKYQNGIQLLVKIQAEFNELKIQISE